MKMALILMVREVSLFVMRSSSGYNIFSPANRKGALLTSALVLVQRRGILLKPSSNESLGSVLRLLHMRGYEHGVEHNVIHQLPRCG